MTATEQTKTVERIQDILVNQIGDTRDLNKAEEKKILPHGPGLNLSPKHWAQSDVSTNRDKVVVGTRLIYSDQCNYSEFIVTKLIEGGFEIKNIDSDYSDIQFFDNLQLGWKFN